MLDRKVLFDRVRADVFGGSINQDQVNGIGAILDEWEKRGLTNLAYLAYFLATPMIETGGKFAPTTESLNYAADALKLKFSRSRISLADADRYGRKGTRAANQEAIGNLIYGGEWGRANLGNTEPGDGFKFRGRGLAQLTGRRNYTLAAKAVGVPLLTDPDRATELVLSVAIMFDAMLGGWFTGKKLSDYLDGPTPDFVNARRTINGTDRAGDIADYARKFLAALRAADRPAIQPLPRDPVPIPPPPDIPASRPQLRVPPAPPAAPEPQGFWAWLFSILSRIFGGRNG